MKRILQVTGPMNRGGAETMLMTLYRALDTTQFQFDFLEFGPGRSDYADEIESLGGRILKATWSQNPRKLPATIQHLADLMMQSGPFAAAHSHILFASGTVLAAAKRAGVPIRIAHSHAAMSSRSSFLSSIYQATSRSAIRRVATHMGVVVPNAVDTSRFFPVTTPQRDRVRDALGLPRDMLVLSSVARFEKVKNHAFLLDLADVLSGRGVEFLMLFIGDGSLRSELETGVDERQLGQRVRFLGLRSDVPELLQASDTVLMPSLYEGVPVSLIEAQASGIRCLVSDTVGREADLGLGLIDFLPITDPSLWANAVTTHVPPPATQQDVGEAMERRGYTVTSSLARMLSLYTSGS